MSTKGLPNGAKIWRYTVTLETNSGEKKLFESILLTKKQADEEYLELIRDGHKDAAVIADKKAVEAYQAEKDAERKTKKSSRAGSH